MDFLTSAMGHFRLHEPNLEPPDPDKEEVVNRFIKRFDKLSLSLSDLMFILPDEDLETIQSALDQIYSVIEKWEVEYER